jgi:arabinan endo-1,5-alpha-L-arabinosidase
MNTRYLFSLLLCSTLAANAQTLTNPVLDKDFPDPTVIRVNGKYYAYATQGRGHIQVSVSEDLQHWSDPADALPVKPVWADKHFWAPHVLYDPSIQKYVLFYSGESTDTATGKCLGVAYATQPEGPFTDKGSPLICGEGFEHIDPMAFIDPQTGKKLLYWGSGFKPIRVQEMQNDWADFKPGSKPVPVVWPGKGKNYTRLIEGAWLDYHEGKYYLYYSGDNCCGKDANYAVLVSRADHAEGPFESHGVILEKDSVWLAPGHNSVFKDAQGNNHIAYHAIRRQKGGGRVFCISSLVYTNGWPVVKP